MSTPGLYNSRTGSAIKSKYRFFLCAFACFFSFFGFLLGIRKFSTRKSMWTSFSGKGGEGFHREMDQSNDACYVQPTEHLMVNFQRNLYAVHNTSLVCTYSNDFGWRYLGNITKVNACFLLIVLCMFSVLIQLLHRLGAYNDLFKRNSTAQFRFQLWIFEKCSLGS